MCPVACLIVRVKVTLSLTVLLLVADDPCGGDDDGNGGTNGNGTIVTMV